MKRKREVYDVLYDWKQGWWVCRIRARCKDERLDIAVDPIKRCLIEMVSRYCRELWKNGTPCQLVIHRKDGVIQEERTYGHDPRRRKG